MATLPTRELKIGAIIDKTLGVVEHSMAPSLIYLVAITAISSAIGYFTVEMTAPTQQAVIGLVKFAVGVIAAYLLLEAMVRKTGLRSREGEAVFFPYLGLSIVYALGVMVGFILLIIPGLLIMARWSIAQPILVARGEGAMAALGESWERTRGNEFPILVAAVALIIVLIAVVIASSVFFDQASPAGIVITQLASSAITVVSLAMGVALYGMFESARIAASPAN